jgi:cytochrome b subunit of formate dehydrogenase
MRILLKVLYWLAVLAISLALVIGLILWFESRDQSEIEGARGPDQIGARLASV